MKPLIEVRNISKKFILEHKVGRPQTLKEAFTGSLKKWLKKTPKPSSEEFWALKDVSFSIHKGERLGIIGQNGAGKSTLLKILARIQSPTEGSITLTGKIASLLEVGTGFHPDLTGRENIFLNGTILGMSEKEITERFDEIVAFAGIEKFLDTPVKKYSSGMYARLGFSIAAHIDPDILIVDEVLSVGDLQFQEKCLKKLDAMSGEGKTILFVSHNINAIMAVCDKGLYLKNGQVLAQGNIETCVSAYLQTVHSPQTFWQGEAGDKTLLMRKFGINSLDDKQYIRQGEIIDVVLNLDILQPAPGMIIGFDIINHYGTVLASARTTDKPDLHALLENKGSYSLKLNLDTLPLRQGQYRLNAFAMIHNERYIPLEAVSIQLSIYPPADDPRFLHPHSCEGLFLSNQWELTPHQGV
ncbi:MAG: polysaccharide ABC transporter ATP-binding protein [Parachlamydiales bacterium]|jgi:lipopolysaccharide transport system ATP-binding protein